LLITLRNASAACVASSAARLDTEGAAEAPVWPW
jgi:hypothetical protein